MSLSDWLSALTRLVLSNDGGSLDENCPFPDFAKLAADTMYTNFMELYDYLSESTE